MKGQKVLNLMRRTDRYPENSIELATHTQIPKQEKQLNGRNHHIPNNTNTKCYWIQLPNKRHHLANCIRKEI
jgi:hypothetical protein